LRSALFIYCLTHFWMLSLGEAVFWDDWAYYGAPASWVLGDFEETGNFLNLSGFNYVIFSQLGAGFSRFLIFLTGLASTAIFFLISEKHLRFTRNEACLLAAIFSALPFNFARVAYINFNAELCFFLFLLGWLLIEKHRLLSSLSFFIAFQAQSLLPFFLLP